MPVGLLRVEEPAMWDAGWDEHEVASCERCGQVAYFPFSTSRHDIGKFPRLLGVQGDLFVGGQLDMVEDVRIHINGLWWSQ